MPNTVGGYWGTQQFARDLPLPVLYTTSTGLSFSSPVDFAPPYGMVAGDTIIVICTIRMHGGESEMAFITDVPDDWTLISETTYPPPQANPSTIYVYRKEIAGPETDWYHIYRSGPTTPYTVTNKALTSNVATLTIPTHTMNVNDGILVALSPADAVFDGQYNVSAKTATTISYAKTNANVSGTATGGTVNKSPSVGFMNASAHAIRGAGPIEAIVDASMPLPHYVPAITTTKPNTLLLMGYSAKAPLDETINMPPNEVLWYGAGGAYFGQHWNTYERNALIPGTYGPTSIVIANSEQDQYVVMAVSPIPAPPTPDLTVTGLEPASGVIAGGTTITVTGTSFAVGATAVNIGATTIAAGSVTVASSGTSLTFVTPAGPGGVTSVQAVTVTVGAYTSNAKDFTYNATGGFSPASLPGMQFWLDSSEASTLTIGAGDVVSQWRDLGTKDFIFNAPTGEYHSEPTYTEDVNGLPTMLWDADHFMGTFELASSGGKPRTICWVMDPDPAGGDGPPGTTNPGQHGLFLPALMEISATGTLVIGPEGTFETGVATGGMHVWTVLFDSYRSQVWKDGVSVWAGLRGTNMPASTPYVGSHSHHHYHYSGLLPEFAVFHATLTTTQREAMEAYLTNKWAGGPFVPTAPTLASATAGNTTIDLVWTAPSSTGGATITDYDIEVSANGTTGWAVITPDTSGTGLSYTVTGLTNGVIRYYRVKADNSVGPSPPSNVLSATPFLPTPPGAPTLNSATPGSTTVALAWTAGTAGTSATTGYLIEWSANGTTGWATVTTTAVVTTYTDTGLTNGTIRYYRVSGINPVGTGTASNVLSATPNVTFPTLAAVNSEQGTSMGTQAINMPTSIAAGNLLIAIVASDLNGSAGTHTPSTGWTEIRTQLQGSNIVRLSAYGRIADGTGTDNLTVTGPSQDYCAWTGRITAHTVTAISAIPVADAAGSTGNGDPPNLNPAVARAWRWITAEAVDLTTSNTITSVPSGYTETYRNVSASSTSSVAMGVGHKTGDTTSENPGTFTNNPTTRPWVAFTIGIPNLAVAPGAPTLNTATPGNSLVTLAWTAPTNDGGSAITDYTVQWRTTAGPGSWNTFTHAASAATTINVTGLTNATSYDFQVAAVNVAGTSSYSGTQTATPTAPSAITDPTELPSLKLWLDASDTSTFSFSSGTTVSQWRDKSGGGHHFAPRATGPQRANTMSGVDFDDPNVMDCHDDAIHTGSPNLTVCMFEYRESTNSHRSMSFTDGVSGGDWDHAGGTTISNEGSDYPSGTRANTKLASHTGSLTNQWLMWTYVWDSAGNRLYVNGTLDATYAGGSPGNWNINEMCLAGRPGATSEQGYTTIREVVVCGAALNSTQLSSLHNYMTDKWGVLLYNELFTGTNGAGWPSAVTGPPRGGFAYWSTPSAFTIQGNKGQVVTPASTAYGEHTTFLGGGFPLNNYKWLLDTQVSETGNGGWLKMQTNFNDPRYIVMLEMGGGIELRRAGDIVVDTGSIAALADNDNIHWRLERIGGVFRARLWRNAEAEPSTWHVEYDDSAYTATGHEILMTFQNGDTGVSYNVLVDNMSVWDMS